MSHYLSTLQDFAAALNDAQHSCSALTKASRQNITIYRNNIQQNRVNALHHAYSTILALLGEEFFHAMALIYVQAQPAESANLHAEGHSFADFIAQFEPAKDYPYLSDVARLDWAIHAAHYAADVQAISMQVIAEQAESLAELRFEFHPALAICTSEWSIASILAMHHGEAAPNALNYAESALIWRDQYAKISPEQASFFRALQAGQNLGTALEQAAELNSEFDPAESLSLLLQHGLITGLPTEIDTTLNSSDPL